MMVCNMYFLSNMDILGIYVKSQGGNFFQPHWSQRLRSHKYWLPQQVAKNSLRKTVFCPSKESHWLVVSTHLKNISQIGNLPQIGVKIKNIWNHHLEQFFPSKESQKDWKNRTLSSQGSTPGEIERDFFVDEHVGRENTWMIIPVSKWLVTPIYKPFRPFGRGTTLLRGLTITMVINHLQVLGWSSK